MQKLIIQELITSMAAIKVSVKDAQKDERKAVFIIVGALTNAFVMVDFAAGLFNRLDDSQHIARKLFDLSLKLAADMQQCQCRNMLPPSFHQLDDYLNHLKNTL